MQRLTLNQGTRRIMMTTSLVQRQAAVLGARTVSYDTGDKKGRVMSLEEEQRVAAQQYKDQQKLSPKLDDETVRRFHEPWQGVEKRESEMADVEGMGLSESATEAIGEVMEGAVQALEGTMPLKRKGGPEIKP